MKNLTIDPERLWGDLMDTARIGATAKGGICRLTLTDLDRQVRDWFRAQAEALGCTVTIDDMGNMFARREGTRTDVPPIAAAIVSTLAPPVVQPDAVFTAGATT